MAAVRGRCRRRSLRIFTTRPTGMRCTFSRCPTQGNPALLALKDEGDRLVLRPVDADLHGAIRRKCIAFESHGAGLRGGHLQDVVIPLGLGLEVLAAMNRRTVLAVAGAVVIEEGLGDAFIFETT